MMSLSAGKGVKTGDSFPCVNEDVPVKLRSTQIGQDMAVVTTIT